MTGLFLFSFFFFFKQPCWFPKCSVGKKIKILFSPWWHFFTATFAYVMCILRKPSPVAKGSPSYMLPSIHWLPECHYTYFLCSWHPCWDHSHSQSHPPGLYTDNHSNSDHQNSHSHLKYQSNWKHVKICFMIHHGINETQGKWFTF